MNPYVAYGLFLLRFSFITALFVYFSVILYQDGKDMLFIYLDSICYFCDFYTEDQIVASNDIQHLADRQSNNVTHIKNLIFIISMSLVWWRVIKVFVLLGVPFRLGILTRFNNDDETRNRLRQCMFIGKFNQSNPLVLYAAAFRLHPNSDKLVRTRLENLLFAVSPKYVVSLYESRITIVRRTHAQRFQVAKARFRIADDSTDSEHKT